jgi:hypothetical protein
VHLQIECLAVDAQSQFRYRLQFLALTGLTSMCWLQAAVALVGLTTDKLRNQAVPLCGPTSISQHEQVEAINRLRQREGKKPIDLIILSPEEWKAKMVSWRKDDFDPAFADQLIAWWKENDNKPELIQSSEPITGRPSQSYDEWLELNKDAFLKD